MGHYRRDLAKCQELCDELIALPDNVIIGSVAHLWCVDVPSRLLWLCVRRLVCFQLGLTPHTVRSQCLLQAADTDTKFRQPLEDCLSAFCSRSVLLAFQASWWFKVRGAPLPCLAGSTQLLRDVLGGIILGDARL